MSIARVLRATGLAIILIPLIANAQDNPTAPTSGPANRVLRRARPGQIVGITDLDFAKVPTLPVQIINKRGPQLVFSDMPEYFRTGDGIALQERVERGRVRLYIYHCPDPAAKEKTISAVVENVGIQPMSIQFIRRAFPKPGKDYNKIGKEGLAGYFQSAPETESRRIAVGDRAVVDPDMDKAVVSKDDLVHGFYEFEISEPARITVFQREPTADSLQVIDKLPKLPAVLNNRPSGAGRGLFKTSDFAVTTYELYDTAKGPAKIVVADGKTDAWVTGRDSLSNNDEAKIKGNYGVMYKIGIRRACSDKRALALVMYNPHSAQYCDTASATVVVSDGIYPGGVVELPSDRTKFGSAPQAVVMQRFDPLRPGLKEDIEITYSPPGGSCLPTPLLLIPYEP